MNWAQQQRQEYIYTALYARGYINREHIMAAFGVSTPTASKDLKVFLASKDAVELGVQYSHQWHCYTTATQRFKDNLRANAGTGASE